MELFFFFLNNTTHRDIEIWTKGINHYFGFHKHTAENKNFHVHIQRDIQLLIQEKCFYMAFLILGWVSSAKGLVSDENGLLCEGC